jgi:hypothetical protein
VGVGAGLIVNVTTLVPVWPPDVALRVTLVVPAIVGVPEIKPVVVFTVKPGGNGAAPQLVGLMFAVIWYEKATPTVPVALPLVKFGPAASAVIARLSTTALTIAKALILHGL